ncbi:NUDIX hydrolase [Nonomuraea jabiensis]|uniref:NUDIX hydrolase n=1 Tax=Nonomuraea jabiensis TaxID=882448 RepID=UPI0034428FB8
MTHSETREQGTFIQPEIYYAQFASVHVATGALITDREGRVLLVKPNYRPHWLFPGGMADDGEPPRPRAPASCTRNSAWRRPSGGCSWWTGHLRLPKPHPCTSSRLCVASEATTRHPGKRAHIAYP